jgi:Ca2+/H+ antiporter, TMEM165/GDT1 family
VTTSSESDTDQLALESLVDAKPKGNANSVFLSTFITIFLAEMGDKTQLATLLMTAQSHSPLSVLLGSGLALIATSLVAKVIAPETLDILAAVLMLVIAILLLGDVVEL